MGKSKSLDTKINSEPSNVPTPLPNQVEVLANINHNEMKTIGWEDIAENIRKIKEKIENPTRSNKTPSSQLQTVSQQETNSKPPV